ncbi:MAG: TolC family protein [Clostridium sp.]|nr:TolC family protein [Clostridium sp.]
MKRKSGLRRWLVWAAVMPCACLTWAQQAPRTLRLTLDRAVEIALADNPVIHVAEQDIELKKVSRKEAWQSLLPTVELNGGMTYTVKAATMNLGGNKFKMGQDGTSTWNGALSVNLPLYAPAVYRTMKMTRTDIELAVEKSRGSRQDVVNQVAKAYYQLMLAQDSYDVLRRSYDHSERNFNVVSAKYRQGSVSEYDKISAEVQMRNLKPGVVAAENAISLARLQLKVLLGVSDKELLVEIDDSLARYEERVSEHRTDGEISLAGNTQLRQIDLNGRLLEHNLKIQKTNFIPTLAFNYAYQYQSLYNNNFELWHYDWFPSSTFGLTLSVPLYRASNFTKLKTTRIQLRQLAENRLHTERQLGMQAQSCLDNMQASAAQVSSNRESMAQAEKGLLIAEKRYEVGKGTVLEMNSSEVALTQARLAFNQSIYDYLVARADLDYVTGAGEYATNKQ